MTIESLNIESEPELDLRPMLRSRETELSNIITSIESVRSTKEWQTLSSLVFEGVVETLDRQISTEAKKDDPDKMVLARLNGQLMWAKKYTDLGLLSEFYRNQLKGTQNQLKELDR